MIIIILWCILLSHEMGNDKYHLNNYLNNNKIKALFVKNGTLFIILLLLLLLLFLLNQFSSIHN